MKIIKIGLSIILLCLAIIGSTQTGVGFEITKSTIDSGGGKSSDGANFVVTGTIGQADASNKLEGVGFSLTGGFWSGVSVPKPDEMFKNGFEN